METKNSADCESMRFPESGNRIDAVSTRNFVTEKDDDIASVRSSLARNHADSVSGEYSVRYEPID